MNLSDIPEHEAVFICSTDAGWQLTGAFRNGTPDSVLAVDVGNTDEFAAIPEHLRTASWPFDRPCVTLQSGHLAVLHDPRQVMALAQWLVAASVALERANASLEEEDGE